VHQSLYQIDEQLRNTLLNLGTYVFGRAATMSEARLLADVLFKRDPYLVKHWRKVWGSEAVLSSSGRVIGSTHVVIDHEPEFMSLEDQQERFGHRIYEQGLFEFLLRPAVGEGEVSQEVIPISIANAVLDTETGEYQFPDQEAVAKLRSLLAAHAGVSLRRLLAEQEALLVRRQLPPQHEQENTRHPRTEATSEKSSVSAAASAETPRAMPKPPRHSSHQRRQRIASNTG